MTFLSLNGTTIPCLSPNVDEDADEHGLDRARMFDGAIRVIRRGLFRSWSITTRALDPAGPDYAAIRALVNTNNPPLTATGDLVESTDGVFVVPIPGKNTPVMTAAGLRRRISFTLKETPSIPLADTSAPLDAFWRGDFGYKKGDWVTPNDPSILEALDDASEGDSVSAWLDQSGNRRHWMGGVDNFSFNNHSDGKSPLVNGGQLRFGTSAATNCRILQNTDVTDWWTGLTKAEVMIAFRPNNPTPVTNGKNGLWMLPVSGGAGVAVRYPAADGHLYETFMAPGGGPWDLGVNPVDFSEQQVLSVVAGAHADSPNFFAYLANILRYSTTELDVSYPAFSDVADIVLGFSASEYFDGWIRHMAVFSAPLNASQRLSWYNFMSGAVTDPPIG